MHTGSGRCSIFAMRTTSNYLPRLASAARRVQGPRSGTFRKLDTVVYNDQSPRARPASAPAAPSRGARCAHVRPSSHSRLR